MAKQARIVATLTGHDSGRGVSFAKCDHLARFDILSELYRIIGKWRTGTIPMPRISLPSLGLGVLSHKASTKGRPIRA